MTLKNNKYMELWRAVAYGLYEWEQFTQLKPDERYVPASEAAVVNRYQNDPIFHRVVKTMITTIDEVFNDD